MNAYGGEGLVWLIGGGGVFAGCLPRVQLFVSMCNGRPHLLALQHHWLLPINCYFDDCKARLVRFLCKTRYIRIPDFSDRHDFVELTQNITVHVIPATT